MASLFQMQLSKYNNDHSVLHIHDNPTSMSFKISCYTECQTNVFLLILMFLET